MESYGSIMIMIIIKAQPVGTPDQYNFIQIKLSK